VRFSDRGPDELLDGKEAASLTGLAPVARQSGQWKGKSFIRGGRANVRQGLFMPALIPACFNPDLKSKYQQMVTAGEPAKVAITTVMRKLVVTANACSKQIASGSNHALDHHRYSKAATSGRRINPPRRNPVLQRSRHSSCCDMWRKHLPLVVG
jgi:hypothetical protein